MELLAVWLRWFDMDKKIFEPLTIEGRKLGKFRTVSSVTQAYEVLLSEWDGRKQGPACLRAKMACQAAIEGTQSEAEARRAFLDAAAEANILVDDHSRSWRRMLLKMEEVGNSDLPSQERSD